MEVLITGANGQLGQCIQLLQHTYTQIRFVFSDVNELDITDKDQIRSFFSNYNFDYVINCAAYTNVEQAEKNIERAFLINAHAVKNLAEVCKKYDATLIHISTDYVFDGENTEPYVEEDIPNPINVYGRSKLQGEQYIQQILEKYFIVRTSWLYSQFGKNFYKTMLQKSVTENKLTITTSEVGAPTNANDLANFIMQLIEMKSKKYGLYHFSNLGNATWYDFAKEIFKISGKLYRISLEKTDNYPTLARRPKYSVLSKAKITKTFSIDIMNWKDSLNNLYKK